MRWVVVIAVIAGCVDVGVQHCADGSVCPAGTRCSDPAGCVAVGGCGDGVVGGSEVCDDGNQLDGDGCSHDCLRIEACGNQIVEGAEECDDGNFASHDGCSSGCLVETPVWTQVATTGPRARHYTVAAWDADRGRAVLTGGMFTPMGMGETIDDETWIWHAGAWTQGPDVPTTVAEHAFTEDGTGAMLLFGGETSPGACAVSSGCRPCYLLRGDTWTACTTLQNGRYDHGAARARGGGALMWGGVTANGFPSDAWLWTGSTWTPVDGGPQARITPALVFDSIAERTFVVGGSGSLDRATYWWDGQWHSTSNELARFAHGVAFDPARKKLIAFGGQLSGGTEPTDVLESDGISGWQTVAVASGPAGRFGHAMFYDPIAHAAVVFGGYAFDDLGDTWTLRWESATPDDACDGTDADGDGLGGCDDPDCWARCTPRCPPGASCADADPRCGDGTCNPDLEDHALCPADC